MEKEKTYTITEEQRLERNKELATYNWELQGVVELLKMAGAQLAMAAEKTNNASVLAVKELLVTAAERVDDVAADIVGGIMFSAEEKDRITAAWNEEQERQATEELKNKPLSGKLN